MKLKKKIVTFTLCPQPPKGLSVFLPSHLVTLQGAKDREELTSRDVEGLINSSSRTNCKRL